MKLLEGKVALITGAARGIGRALVQKFAENGACVAYTIRKEDENSKSLSDVLTKIGGNHKAYSVDVSNFEDVHKIINAVHVDFGRIDVLINNAGITMDGILMRMTENQWDEVIRVNLKSAFNFVHACTPIMMKQRMGSIINMSSIVGETGNAGQANYAASKAGIIGLTKSVAKELGSRNIRANCITPGYIITDMTDVLSDEVRKQWESNIPLRRGGSTEDVANTAVFLASDMSAYITGQCISVAGGLDM